MKATAAGSIQSWNGACMCSGLLGLSMLFRRAQPLGGWGAAIILALAYAACCIPAVYAAERTGSGPGVWLPNGILAGALLVLRPRPAILLFVACGFILALMHVWKPAYYASGFIIIDLGVPLAVAGLARRFCGAAMDLSRASRLWRFAALAAAPPVLASSVMGSFLSQSAFQQPGVTLAGVWFLTDLFGVVLGGVTVLTFVKRTLTTPKGRTAEAFWLVLLTGATTLALFAFSQPLAVIFPLLLLITFRLGAAWSALSVAVFVAIAAPLFLITQDSGLLGGAASPVTRVGQLHLFVALILLCTFPAFIALADRTRDRARLARQSLAARRERALAEAGNQAKSRFLAMMSHELRTPLNGIWGAGDLLAARADLPSDAAQHIENLRRACGVLVETVDDILDFTRCETGKVDLVSEPFSITELLDRTTAVMGARAAEKALDLVTSMGPGGDQNWIGDPRRLVQILLNLVSNAVRFTDNGGIVVRAGVQPLGNAGALVLEVEDTGVGFPPEALPFLFEPFTQAAPGVWRTRGGSGLGLAICKSLTEQMGGSISASSRPGAGTRFRVQVPVVRAVPGGPDADAAPIARLVGRALVVEDEPLSRDLAVLILENAGLEVESCACGRSAVEAVRSAGFDMVFMDIGLPDLDGLEATAEIRSMDPPARDMPVIALSAFTTLSAASLIGSGFTEVLTKPVRSAALIDCAARHVTEGASGGTRLNGSVAEESGSVANGFPMLS